MPLFLRKNILPSVYLGIWKIDESLDDFFSLYPFLRGFQSEVVGLYKSDQRCREILAVRLLIREIIDDNVLLFHKENGCPFLSNGMNIGISHTRGYAVVIVSSIKKVAVDIEYINKRVLRIKDKFMRDDEHADSLFEYMIHWCTKETIYKLFSEDKLSYNEMQLLSISHNGNDGIIAAKNIVRNKDVEVYYHTFDDIVFTFTAL